MNVRLLFAVVAVLSTLWPAGASAIGPDDHLRFGLGLGVVGALPVGDDVNQPGASEDEFQAGLALEIEVLTFDIGQYVQLVPFLRLSVAGGANGRAYEDAIDVALETPDTRMSYFGLGARFFPVRWGNLRPFVSGYVGYATSRVTYLLPTPELPGGLGDLLGAAARIWRHTGVGFTLGLGLRWDFPITMFGDDVLVPLILEGQWRKNVWLDLEQSGGDEVDDSNLAGPGMNLDMLSAQISIGLMF